jgi:hypothetical protein
VADRLGAHHELALTWLEIGSRTGERSALEKAELLFADLGDEIELARTRGQLGRVAEPDALTAAAG